MKAKNLFIRKKGKVDEESKQNVTQNMIYVASLWPIIL